MDNHQNSARTHSQRTRYANTGPVIRATETKPTNVDASTNVCRRTALFAPRNHATTIAAAKATIGTTTKPTFVVMTAPLNELPAFVAAQPGRDATELLGHHPERGVPAGRGLGRSTVEVARQIAQVAGAHELVHDHRQPTHREHHARPREHASPLTAAPTTEADGPDRPQHTHQGREPDMALHQEGPAERQKGERRLVALPCRPRQHHDEGEGQRGDRRVPGIAKERRTEVGAQDCDPGDRAGHQREPTATPGEDDEPSDRRHVHERRREQHRRRRLPEQAVRHGQQPEHQRTRVVPAESRIGPHQWRAGGADISSSHLEDRPVTGRVPRSTRSVDSGQEHRYEAHGEQQNGRQHRPALS